MNAEDIISKLDEEANSLVSEPVDPKPEEEEEDTLTDDQDEVVDDVSDPLDEPEEVVETQTTQRENWKKRFINYKTSTDQTIRSLRLENAQFKNEVSSLITEVRNLRKLVKENKSKEDPFLGVFTEQEVEAFGPEGLDVIKKAARAVADKELKPYVQEQEQVEQRRAEQLRLDAERERRLEYQQFLDDLSSYCEDYQELNHDPKFIKWLNGFDRGSRVSRLVTLQNAEKIRDAQRVSEFFLRFKNSSKGKIDKHLALNTSRASEVPLGEKSTKPNEINEAFIEKFTRDVQRGFYVDRPKEALEIEKKIDRYYEWKLQELSGSAAYK